MMELTAGQLPELRDALLIDIRSGEERAYGVIEGARAASPEELTEIASRERGRKLVLICARSSTWPCSCGAKDER